MHPTLPSSAPVGSRCTRSRRDAQSSGRPVGEITQIGEVTLDGWTACDWTQHGLQIEGIEPLQVFCIRTRNSVYDLAVASDRAGDVFVRGGRFFPEWTRVQLAGASVGGAFLKRHGVYIGFCLEFYWSGRRVVTSRVHSIARESPPMCESAASSGGH